MLKKKSIVLTGCTSFTGYCIAKKLIENDFIIYAPLSQENYVGIKRERLNLIPEINIISPLDINAPRFIDELNRIKPDIFINHAAFVNNYRSEDFDVLKHLETNLLNLKPILHSLKNNQCKLIIHSGSSFEPNEGYSIYGLSPYGVAKKMVWDLLAYFCHINSISLIKVIIPNPYGYLENEDRLLPTLYRQILENKNINIINPDVVRNNIRGEVLAEYYVQACRLSDSENINIQKIQPIGNIETQINFVFRALQEYPYNLKLEEIQRELKI